MLTLNTPFSSLRAANASDKFPEFARTLLKAYGSDYIIPDNLAQYAEEYMEDYRGAPDHHSGENGASIHRLPVTCLPTPSEYPNTTAPTGDPIAECDLLTNTYILPYSPMLVSTRSDIGPSVSGANFIVFLFERIF